MWCDCTLSFRCEPKENHCKFYMYYLEKQLKAKEQECEEFRKANDEKNELLAKLGCPTTATAKRKVFCLQEQLDQLKAEKEEIKKYLGISHKTILERLEELTDFRDRDREEIDQLKAKNNEYSLFIEKLCDYIGLECDSEEQAMRTLLDLASQMNKAIWIIDKYKQTLTEIKEIAEWHKTSADSEDVQEDMKQILQKISECEVEKC